MHASPIKEADNWCSPMAAPAHVQPGGNLCRPVEVLRSTFEHSFLSEMSLFLWPTQRCA